MNEENKMKENNMKENTMTKNETVISISPNDHLDGHGLGEKIEIPPIILMYKERLDDLKKLLFSLDEKKELNEKQMKEFQKKMFICLANIVDKQADPVDLDFNPLLEKRREVCIYWGIDNVKCYRQDLTDDQAWEVLQEFYGRFENEPGVHTELLQDVINDLFPEENEE